MRDGQGPFRSAARSRAVKGMRCKLRVGREKSTGAATTQTFDREGAGSQEGGLHVIYSGGEFDNSGGYSISKGTRRRRAD